MQSRRAFVSGATLALSTTVGCAPPLVQHVPNGPIAPDARGALLVGINIGRARAGPVFVGTPEAILGACPPLTYFVAILPPGRHFIVASDDESYDASEADLAPNGIYGVHLEHGDDELQIRPLVPHRDPIRRMLDETDRVEFARGQPKREAVETFQRRVRLAKIRYADYPQRKRDARAIGQPHMWPLEPTFVPP